MKTTSHPKLCRFSPTQVGLPRRLALSGLLLLGAAATPASAAINEDEWYDPSDWFDGNNFEYDDTYDYDPYDYTYNSAYDYGYDWDYWDRYDDAYSWNDYDSYDAWDYDYNSSYWDKQDWSSSATTSSGADQSTSGTLYTYSIWVPDEGTQASQTGSKQANQAGNSGSQQSKKQDGQKQGMARLDGTIEGLKNIDLQRSSGASGTFTLAKVKLENGQSVVVNLGRQSQLQDANVKKGDQLRAIGRRGNIQGQNVFVAQKLRVNGKDIDANPTIRLKGDKNSRSQTVQSGSQGGTANPGASATSAAKQTMKDWDEELSGTVAGIDSVKGSGKEANRTLVKLTLENGKSETVDLGPGASPEKIGLDKGDTVTVRGRRDSAQGRNVIVAELIQVNGSTVKGGTQS